MTTAGASRTRNGLREIAAPFVVAAPTGARVRTSLRVSPQDHDVLWTVGRHLGSLAGRDLASRCAMGRVPGKGKHAGRAERKKAITAESSSRWAGAITRWSADQWERGLKNLMDERASLRRAVSTIERRLAAPAGGKAGRVRGYRTEGERFQKQRRLAVLRERLAEVEARVEAGRVSVVRGGRRLAHARHYLADAGLTGEQWGSRWEASRLFLSADGEAGKQWGNETIRVHPEEGWLEVRLPTPLAHLSNTPGRAPTYRLSCDVRFSHRADEWAAQAASGAVRYDITYDAERRRWYLDASWQTKPVPPPPLDELQRHRTLEFDLNDGHLAAWVVGPDGNPVGSAVTVPMVLDGPTARRDGLVCQAVTDLLDIAERHGCRCISIENLDFADARSTGRETMGRGRRGKRFRRTVAGLPTSRFRARLVGMAHNRGLAVVAVDPAYTSVWGGEHWQKPLLSSHSKNSGHERPSRHHAAAVVIGRRSLGHRARRRARSTEPDRRIRNGELRSRPGTTPAARPPRSGEPDAHAPPGGKTLSSASRAGGGGRAPNRSVPNGQDSLLPTI